MYDSLLYAFNLPKKSRHLQNRQTGFSQVTVKMFLDFKYNSADERFQYEQYAFLMQKKHISWMDAFFSLPDSGSGNRY